MKPFIGKYPFEVETFQVDYTGGLSFGFLANKMLITAGNHANERGFGKERLSADGKTWVLSRLAIEIDEYPNEGDTYYVLVQKWLESQVLYSIIIRIFIKLFLMKIVFVKA